MSLNKSTRPITAPTTASPTPKAASPAVPAASVDDTAAYLREAPVLAGVLAVQVPPKVPGRDATFAQQDLRKLDADLAPDTDVALHQLVALGPAARDADLGPAATQLRGLDDLVQRRTDVAAVVTRLRALLDYAETQQRVFDHDAVLILEAVGEAVTFLGRYDDSLRERYGAVLDVLAARNAKIAEGRARARAAAAPVPEPKLEPTPA